MNKVVKATEYVFVYGSLMSKMSNHHEMRDAEYIGEFKTVNKYLLIMAEWAMLTDLLPYTQKDVQNYSYEELLNQQVCVKGEVYKVPKSDLKRLDEFEECPALYNRENIKVSGINEKTGKEMQLTVHAYFNNMLSKIMFFDVIESGDYREYNNLLHNKTF